MRKIAVIAAVAILQMPVSESGAQPLSREAEAAAVRIEERAGRIAAMTYAARVAHECQIRSTDWFNRFQATLSQQYFTAPTPRDSNGSFIAGVNIGAFFAGLSFAFESLMTLPEATCRDAASNPALGFADQALASQPR